MSDATNTTNDEQVPSRSTGHGAKRGRRRALIAGGAAVVLLGGGAAVAAGTGMIGGSAQPESVLPGDAMFFAKVDLDPGVAQKVGAFRLFDKLPEAKQALGAQDPKKALFDLAKKSDDDLASVDYDRDIAPWLGDRAGFALLAPQGSSQDPVPVLALAVKDEDKAREGVARLSAAGSSAATKARTTASKAGAAAGLESGSGGTDDEMASPIFKDGYVLLADKKDESRVQQSLNGAALADNETFGGDMSTIGETGVASGWMDGSKFLALARNQADKPDSSQKAVFDQLSGMSGRTAFALRFASDHLELSQVSRGVQKGVNSPAVQGIKDLPADTAGFLSFTGGSDYVKQWWPVMQKLAGQDNPNFDKEMRDVEQQTGLAVPADLQTLLGSQFDVVAAKQDFENLQGAPKVGVRTWTDTAKAQSIIDKVRNLMQQSGEQFPVVTQTHGGHLDAGLDESYTSTLAGGGTLGSNPGFQAVLPDVDQSSGALFVDLDAIESQYLDSVPADERDLVRSLQAVGMTTGPVVNGEQHSTMRISVN